MHGLGGLEVLTEDANPVYDAPGRR